MANVNGKTSVKNGVDISVEGRVPPHATDLERAILGALLMEPMSYISISQTLTADVFYSPAHQLIFEAMAALAVRSQPVDILTVNSELQRMGHGDKVPVHVLTKLTQGVVSSANIVGHAAIVLQKYVQRQMIKIGLDMVAGSYNHSADPLVQLADAENKLAQINLLLNGNRTQNFDDMVATQAKLIMDNDGNNPPGIQTGWTSIDRILMALFPYLHILAARPSMGKTSFMIAMIRNIGRGTKHYPSVPVGVLEIETSEVPFIQRMIANVSGIDTKKLKRGGLTPQEKERVQEAAGEILQMRIYANFIPTLSRRQIRSQIKVWVIKYGVRIVFLDYLQLVPQEENDRSNRESHVARVAEELAAICKEMGIVIVALAQLSRAVTNRSDKRPILQDIRESGAVEQAGRVIMALHRPEYYKEDTDIDGNKLPAGTTEVLILKNNEGEIGNASLIMKPGTSTFIDEADELMTWRAAVDDSDTTPF